MIHVSHDAATQQPTQEARCGQCGPKAKQAAEEAPNAGHGPMLPSLITQGPRRLLCPQARGIHTRCKHVSL